MNLGSKYNQPLPLRVKQFLLFVKAAVGIISVSSILSNHPTVAAWALLLTGVLSQAVDIFVGEESHKPNPTHEADHNSTLSNRRTAGRMRKDQTKPAPNSKKGGTT